MPKSENSNSNDGPSFQAPRYRPNWLAAVICLLLGAFLTVALVAYNPGQNTFNTTSPVLKNPVGWIGADAVYCLLFAVGASTWLLPFFLFWMLYVSIKRSKHLSSGRVVAMVIASVVFAGLAAMLEDAKWSSDYFPKGYGGYIGVVLYHRLLADALGPFGSGLLLGTIYCGAQLFVFTWDIGAEIEKIFAGISAWWADRGKQKAALAEQRTKEREAQLKAQKNAAAAAPLNAPPALPLSRQRRPERQENLRPQVL